MAVPVTNTTCDIYRAGNSPPAAPDVPAVRCYFAPKGRSTLTSPYFTHILLVPATTDIRDAYAPGSIAFQAGADKVFIPDKASSVQYRVCLVRRVGLGTALDHKEVLLVREVTSWPTDDL